MTLYQAAAAMDASARWQEAVAENLAEVSRPGFKKHDITFSAMMAGKMEKPFESLKTTTDPVNRILLELELGVIVTFTTVSFEKVLSAKDD